MEVGNLIAGSAVSCLPSVSLRESATTMQSSEIGSVAVVERGNLLGIFTERDLLRALALGADPDLEKVRDWMTADPDTIQPDLDVDEAAVWMMATGHRHLPVTNEAGDLVGIVSIKDVLWAMTELPVRRPSDARKVDSY